MPTRRYSVAMDYRAAAPVRVFTPGIVNGTKAFFYTGNTAVDAGKICVTNSRSVVLRPRRNHQIQRRRVLARLCGQDPLLREPARRASLTRHLGAGRYRCSSRHRFLRLRANAERYQHHEWRRWPAILGSSFIKLTNPQASAGMSGTYGITCRTVSRSNSWHLIAAMRSEGGGHTPPFFLTA